MPQTQEEIDIPANSQETTKPSNQSSLSTNPISKYNERAPVFDNRKWNNHRKEFINYLINVEGCRDDDVERELQEDRRWLLVTDIALEYPMEQIYELIVPSETIVISLFKMCKDSFMKASNANLESLEAAVTACLCEDFSYTIEQQLKDLVKIPEGEQLVDLTKFRDYQEELRNAIRVWDAPEPDKSVQLTPSEQPGDSIPANPYGPVLHRSVTKQGGAEIINTPEPNGDVLPEFIIQHSQTTEGRAQSNKPEDNNHRQTLWGPMIVTDIDPQAVDAWNKVADTAKFISSDEMASNESLDVRRKKSIWRALLNGFVHESRAVPFPDTKDTFETTIVRHKDEADMFEANKIELQTINAAIYVGNWILRDICEKLSEWNGRRSGCRSIPLGFTNQVNQPLQSDGKHLQHAQGGDN